MEYKKLGLTELEISRIGFGCWAIGGHGYGKVDDKASIKAIRKALDLGINFFDTADVYGFGHSEIILSKALSSQRGKVIIATKFGVNWDENGNTFYDCSPKRVVEAVEGSLRRLKIDCIPLYQIHWYDNTTPISETIESLKKCQEAGKIHYIGCSNFSAKLILEVSRISRIETIQFLYNIIQRDLEKDILECVESLKIVSLAYGVLARGLLSGKYDLTTKFGDNDTRSRDKEFQEYQFKNNLQLVEVLKQIGMRYSKTPSHVSIRWALDNPFITCCIVGAKTKEQVAENVLSLDWKLKKGDIDIINSFKQNMIRTT